MTSALDRCACGHYKGNHRPGGSCIHDSCGCPAFAHAGAAVLDPHTHARTTDPETSAAAARSLSDKTTMLTRLLAAYHNRRVGGLTAEEATDEAGYEADDGAWKRVSDLRGMGLIEGTDQSRIGRAGRLQMVLRITDLGKAVHIGSASWPKAARRPDPPVAEQPDAGLAVALVAAEGKLQRIRTLCEEEFVVDGEGGHLAERVLAILDSDTDPI